MTVEWGRSEEIVRCPDKFKLSMGLFTGQPVQFVLENSGPIDVVILQIQAEDGSRESWNVDGLVSGQGGRHFKAYLRTDNPRGRMTLESRVRVSA